MTAPHGDRPLPDPVDAAWRAHVENQEAAPATIGDRAPRMYRQGPVRRVDAPDGSWTHVYEYGPDKPKPFRDDPPIDTYHGPVWIGTTFLVLALAGLLVGGIVALARWIGATL